MQISKVTTSFLPIALAAILVMGSVALANHDGDPHSTGKFEGVKANTGSAMHFKANGKNMLKVSDDFQIPDTPAPHWQVVDSKGNVYLLNQFKIKGNKTNREIAVPAYVKDIAKVQVWCSFAEALLGEASFDRPVR